MDVREISGRYQGDIREISGRYQGDVRVRCAETQVVISYQQDIPKQVCTVHTQAAAPAAAAAV
jgi:hypothetical protein